MKFSILKQMLGLNYNKLCNILDTSASGPIILGAGQVGKSALYSGSLPLEGGIVLLFNTVLAHLDILLHVLFATFVLLLLHIIYIIIFIC